MSLKLKNGVEVKVTDLSVNNETKVTTFTVSPSDVDTLLRESGNVHENTFTMKAPVAMVGASLKEAYQFTKKLPFYKGAKDA
jgi:hypothetical protein